MPNITFTVKINADNAAFGCDSALHWNARHECEQRNYETARILRTIADRLDTGQTFEVFETLFDSNGNDVGRAKFVRR